MLKLLFSTLFIVFIVSDSLQAPVRDARGIQTPQEEVQQIPSSQPVHITEIPGLSFEEANRMPVWEFLKHRPNIPFAEFNLLFGQHPDVKDLKPKSMSDISLAKELCKLYGNEPDERHHWLTNSIKNFLKTNGANKKLMDTFKGVHRRLADNSNLKRRLTKLKQSSQPEDIAMLERIRDQRRKSATKSRMLRKQGMFISFDEYMEMLHVPVGLTALQLEERARGTLELGQDSIPASIMLKDSLIKRGYKQDDIEDAMAQRRAFLIGRGNVTLGHRRKTKRAKAKHGVSARASTSSDQDMPGPSDGVHVPSPLSLLKDPSHPSRNEPQSASTSSSQAEADMTQTTSSVSRSTSTPPSPPHAPGYAPQYNFHDLDTFEDGSWWDYR